MKSDSTPAGYARPAAPVKREKPNATTDFTDFTDGNPIHP